MTARFRVSSPSDFAHMTARFRVSSPSDFTHVERHVSSHLSGEGDRCAFLRSAAFTRFRVRCLYRPKGRVPPCWAGGGRLRLEFEREAPRRAGGWVTVEVRDGGGACEYDYDYDDSWGVASADEGEDPSGKDVCNDAENEIK